MGVKKRREVIHDFVVEYHGMDDEVTGSCMVVEIPNEKVVEKNGFLFYNKPIHGYLCNTRRKYHAF